MAKAVVKVRNVEIDIVYEKVNCHKKKRSSGWPMPGIELALTYDDIRLVEMY